MNQPSAAPQPTAAELEQAIHGNRLRLVYQPKVSLVSNALAGVEALVRWQHERHGWIPPADFIPVAEESGLIEPLTRWVLATAASDWVAWNRDGLTVDVAVNISPKTLDQLDFPDRMADICQSQGMPCTCLTVELTESATQGAIELLDTLTRCRLKGMKISLDDFGTGYSSLSYLHRLPVDTLKLDRSFVLQLGINAAGAEIVAAVVGLAHRLGMDVITEGLETQEQIDALRTLGADLGQGFHFGRAEPLVGAAEIVRKSL